LEKEWKSPWCKEAILFSTFYVNVFFLDFNQLPKGKEGQFGMAKDKASRGKMKRKLAREGEKMGIKMERFREPKYMGKCTSLEPNPRIIPTFKN